MVMGLLDQELIPKRDKLKDYRSRGSSLYVVKRDKNGIRIIPAHKSRSRRVIKQLTKKLKLK